ncbi:MAG: site-specific integrase [Muribaculaceae bacterium]|nr:site-specific integrase [Muribaculaceae bacterium]
MAKIEYRLSKRPQQDGTFEIMLRFHHGNLMNLRTGTRIYVQPEFFEYFIDREKCEQNGIRVPAKAETATAKEAETKYITFDRGKIVIRNRVDTPDVVYHREQERKLESLTNCLIDTFKHIESDKKAIKGLSKEWLEEQVDRFHNPQKYVKIKPEDLLPKTLLEAIANYIEQAPTRIQEGNKHNAGKPISARTIIQHKNTQKRVIEYLATCERSDIPLNELGKEFYDDFINFLNSQGYAKNTIGKRIKDIKAMINILPTASRVNCEFVEKGKCSQLSEDIDNVALSEDELKLLAEYPFTGHLAVVRDEFLLLCWTGCRYSDLGKLTKGNIIDLTNGKAFSIRQQKTGADVVIPIMPEIEGILAKYDYQLRKPIANQVFNRFLKDMAKKAGLTDIVKIKRTEGGKEITHELEKWEVVSAHTARRSFATNMYKRKFPTLMIMNITGHTTEVSFLKYIKVSKKENADLMLELVKAWSANQQKGEVEK